MSADEECIFGDYPFGFELAHVATARERAAESAIAHAEMLESDNESERRVAERGRASQEEKVDFFKAHDDETILLGLQYIFDRGRQLEVSGLSLLDVALVMRQEIPAIPVIGGLILEQQPWGYLLFQNGMAATDQ